MPTSRTVWPLSDSGQAVAVPINPAPTIVTFAMDALLQDEKKCDKASPDRAKLFLEEAASSEEARYDSIGYGRDYRFKGKAIVGSALVHREKVVHMAFFRTAGPDKEGQISGYRRPGNFRV